MHRAHTFLVRTMRAAVKDAVRLDAVADDLTAAMFALRRQRMNGALEAIEEMRFTVLHHFDRLVVIVPADFALNHKLSFG